MWSFLYTFVTKANYFSRIRQNPWKNGLIEKTWNWASCLWEPLTCFVHVICLQFVIGINLYYTLQISILHPIHSIETRQFTVIENNFSQSMNRFIPISDYYSYMRHSFEAKSLLQFKKKWSDNLLQWMITFYVSVNNRITAFSQLFFPKELIRQNNWIFKL